VPEHAIQNPGLARAAAPAGITLDGHVVAALNGDQITRDGQTPLATGDTVFFVDQRLGRQPPFDTAPLAAICLITC
jgi:molybdopterin-guanine dinucleotide biosynthesis protein A